MADTSQVAPRTAGKLGCLPGHIPDSLRYLTWYVAGGLPKPPSSVRVPPYNDDRWGMLGNDQYGDCGVAALEHGLEADATIVKAHESFPSDSQAISYYLDYTDDQDTGVVLADYLAYVRKVGYYGHTVKAYAPVSIQDISTIQTAIFLYGFAYTGINVTAPMQQAFENHQPWTTELLDSPIIGGHCIPLVGYNDNYLYAITWGGVQAITYSAWHQISTEAWAIISGEFVKANSDGRGVSLPSLIADLNKLDV